MPKKVDHEERRRQIAEALWRIASRSGLEAASLSEVAAEAGVSKGLVQHYFRSKDEMLLFATRTAHEQMKERARRRLAEVEAPTPLARLRAVLLEMLPLDEESRTGALVGIAFFFRALRAPELAEDYRTGYGQEGGLLAELLRSAMRAGLVPADLDPEREIDVLLSLVGGLGSQVLLGRRTPEDAVAIIDYQLARLAV